MWVSKWAPRTRLSSAGKTSGENCFIGHESGETCRAMWGLFFFFFFFFFFRLQAKDLFLGSVVVDSVCVCEILHGVCGS
jgi:hypothetical protein